MTISNSSMIWKLKSKITRRKSHTDLAILYDSSQLVHDSLMDVGLADHGVVLVGPLARVGLREQ
jgi:hypothetical protein